MIIIIFATVFETNTNLYIAEREKDIEPLSLFLSTIFLIRRVLKWLEFLLSYIKPQPSFVVSESEGSCISHLSYIKPQLLVLENFTKSCCISHLSYIKPQQIIFCFHSLKVVYLIFPTSNHNLLLEEVALLVLYISSFLHQTTTLRVDMP